MTANRISIDAQHPCCVPNATAVENELGNLLPNERIAGLVGVSPHERPLTVTALKSLRTCWCGTVAFDQVGFATMFARNRF